MKRKTLALPGVALATAALLAGCTAPATEPAPDAGGDETLNIGFFGFAAANSFAQGTWGGVEAAERGGAWAWVEVGFGSSAGVAV